VIEEGKALGPQLAGAVLIAKRFQLRKCAHHKEAIPAAECIMSMIGTIWKYITDFTIWLIP